MCHDSCHDLQECYAMLCYAMLCYVKAVELRKFEKVGARLAAAAALVANLSRGRATPCVSEAGGAYNSGRDGLTNAFGSGFWYNDLLGAIGKHAHAMACRQTLVGGRCARRSRRTRAPNPCSPRSELRAAPLRMR